MPLIAVAQSSTPFLMSSIDGVDGTASYVTIQINFLHNQGPSLFPVNLYQSALNVQRSELS